VKRNTIVLGITLLLLVVFAWAGWANWEYRRQAAEKRLAMAAKAELVPSSAAPSSPDAMLTSSPLIGKSAPAFTLQDLSGKKISLASYKGKAVMVNFWATWCGPCKLETPWLVELRNEYAPKGFEILGISAEADDLADNDKAAWIKDKAAIAAFAREEHMQYPVLINGDSISNIYGGLEAMPTSFFVDRAGKVVAVQMGITSKDDMAAKIQKALAE
jgi:cytochrome c biogenesis protein CcmG/thiol:disulfide interchange protein DsbE